jgi:hypothetical protein
VTVAIADLVATYVHAKDSNRPHLMKGAFAPDATLDVVANTGTIAFPPRTAGIDAITATFISGFAQTFENVYTFCLCARPQEDAPTFSSAWLVGMSEKAGGAVRLGSGRYDWVFRAGRVQHLTITIDERRRFHQATWNASWLGWAAYLTPGVLVRWPCGACPRA